jgi:hypothetical protein
MDAIAGSTWIALGSPYYQLIRRIFSVLIVLPYQQSDANKAISLGKTLWIKTDYLN